MQISFTLIYSILIFSVLTRKEIDIMMIIQIIFVILQIIAISFLAKDNNYNNRVLPLIPVVNSFVLADLVPDVNGRVQITKNFSLSKTFFCISYLLSNFLGILPHWLALIGYILQILCLFKISTYFYSLYERKTEEDVAVLAAISSVIPVIFLLKVLIYRSRKGA